MTTLALSMIVKDAEKFLPQCLESVRNCVQELVIADTGSRDSTREIARRFGARVLSVPWHDDFAEARNRCLDEVRSDWVLSLDADEVLDPAAAAKLPALLNGSAVAGYQVTIRNFVLSLQDRVWDQPAFPNDGALPAGRLFPACVDHHNVRLFRNEKNIRFTGRVHESVGPTLLRQKRAIATADFLIYHFGLALAAEERAAKNIFYRQLGRQKLLESPEDAQAHFELALVEMDNFANLDEALRLFSQACKLHPRFAPAWFFRGLVLLRLEKFAESVRCLTRAEALGHRTVVVAETKADALYNLGDYPRASSAYQTALSRDPENPWLQSKLGLALVRSGHPQRGLPLLAAAIALRPDSPDLYDRKMHAHLALNDISAAAQTLDTKVSMLPEPAASDFLRAASLWLKAGSPGRASHFVVLGLASFPQDKNLLMAQQELSFPPSCPKFENSNVTLPSTR